MQETQKQTWRNKDIHTHKKKPSKESIKKAKNISISLSCTLERAYSLCSGLVRPVLGLHLACKTSRGGRMKSKKN